LSSALAGERPYGGPARENRHEADAAEIALTHSQFPVAVGGIGGSGTRVIATFLHMSGFYLGDDLNQALDNLWFTLLFKRRSVLLENVDNFQLLARLFCSRMSGNTDISEWDYTTIHRLADEERMEHSRDWLLDRLYSFANPNTSKQANQRWGWKEPNTHIVIDRLLECQPSLRYVHVVRHPLKMAVSTNQNQLQSWGPIFLNREISVKPHQSLSYWCAAHRRVAEFMRIWPGRMIMIDLEALCTDPEQHCMRLAQFLLVQLADQSVAEFCRFLRPSYDQRPRGVSLKQFDLHDLTYIAQIGYEL
jgi:hypothetical protein